MDRKLIGYSRSALAVIFKLNGYFRFMEFSKGVLFRWVD